MQKNIFGQMVSSIIKSLKKTFCFKGRATKLDFWSFFVFMIIVYFVFGVMFAFAGWISSLIEMSFPAVIVALFEIILLIPLAICQLSLAVRRLHDLGLSGFWLFYLSPYGLPIIYMVYLLDLDKSSNRVVDKIAKVGSPWLGWILTILAWPIGSSVSLLLLFLYDGKDEENEYGPSPYREAEPEEAATTF